jgi:hypothetical protein
LIRKNKRKRLGPGLMNGHAQGSRLKVAREGFADSPPESKWDKRSGYGRQWRFDR